ncbi:DUF3574 domain-containing protein [Erwiniaceae bacterium BAC15a-03b]|uniref:DUF3574 domain-containing protein n=1 Tax=Winslowiella arboricola TaxID=2978220 RepID=A0A9J6PIM9_9GAMM|nr:DUF3574 domain-containing protein [Winslowiella arboricola]MCU5773514.1 DUF3574 domain-containing protein [Winslowiella arboricola]MCU5776574.1 DUF3574 domain-containing protein [Winslowiella arboricola]
MKITNPKIMMITAALLLSGCVASPKNVTVPDCAVGEAMTQTTLYFGLNRPTGPVISAAEWQAFIDNDVTPRFKDGLSVFEAQGQWLGNDGKLARENSKALLLIHAPDKESESRIEVLRTIYKQRFVQDSVMRVDTPVCVAF